MKKKRIKAFMLVEVIAVIVILSIILTIAVPSVINVIRKAKSNYYENQEKALLIAGRNYFVTNRVKLPKEEGNKETVILDVLVDKGYIETIVDENNIPCNKTESYVEVIRLGKGKYKYDARLLCNNYDSLLVWSEWSEWSPTSPTGTRIEVEEAIFYNYQEAGIYYGDWNLWEDVAYNNNLRQVSEQIGTETEERIVYRYQDREWKWYNQTEETVCSADMPTGDGWTKGSACDSEPETVCSATTPLGTGWEKGSSCGTETSSCRSSSPGSGWTRGSSCGWERETSTCSTSGTGSVCAYTTESQCSASSPGSGWVKGSACDSSTDTKCQYASPGTGYVKGSSCGTETSDCVSSSPGTDWVASTVCTRQHSMTSDCQASAPNKWWTAGTICTRKYVQNYCATYCTPPDVGTGMEGKCTPPNIHCGTPPTECRSSAPSGSGWSASSVCTRKWNWSGCHSDGTGSICTRQYTRTKYSWTKTTDTKWTYTREVPSKWYTTTCSSTGTGSACQWYYTRSEYNYTRTVETKWNFNRVVTNYTTDYYSEAPTDYPNKDESQTRLTSWSDWSEEEPIVRTYRTIEQKEQFRTRNVFKDWSGNKLDNYVSKEDLENILGMTIEEIEANPELRLIPVTVYRYRTRIY